MYQILTWSTKYCKRTIEKVWRSKKNYWFAECHLLTRQTGSLPSASCQALSKVFSKKKIFAECLTTSTRQRRTWPNTITRGSLCRVPSFCREPSTRQRRPLPSALFYRVQFFAECDTRQRRSLPSARFLALDKEPVSVVLCAAHSS